MAGLFGRRGPEPLPLFATDEQRAELEKISRAKNMKVGFFAIAAVAALVLSATWNPPTGRVHSFTENSDYSLAKDAGCTNSGDGCHGPEETYADFNTYHPDMECGTCHEYQGVGCIPCHKPPSNECGACHDGTMPEAPDRMRLDGPYPRGHYRESTHTAMGTEFDAEVAAAQGGEAKAICKDCHSRDLLAAHDDVPVVKGSDYDGTVGCGECHNDERAGGLKQVKSDWKDKTCEACHSEDSSAPMHSTEIADEVEAETQVGCTGSGDGCHESNDLHALHADAPQNCSGTAADGERACHDLEREAAKPKARSCGGEDADCHRAYTEDGKEGHKDAEAHSPTSAVAASDTSFYGVACGSCHFMAPDGRSLIDEHERASSDRSTDSDACRNCHNDTSATTAIVEKWPDRDTTDACLACHGQDGLSAPHDADFEGVHSSNSPGCADSGAGCHPTSSIADIGPATTAGGLHAQCLRCHDRAQSGANLAYSPGDTSCGAGRDCHASQAQYSPTTSIHAGTGGTADGTDGFHHSAGNALRTAAYFDDKSGLSVACVTCHKPVLGTEHGRPNTTIAEGSGTLCDRCHNASATTSSIVKQSWTAKNTTRACAACHTAPAHADIAEAHDFTPLSVDDAPKLDQCVKSGCHATADVRRLHRSVGCTPSGCHTSEGDIRGRNITSCGGSDPRTSCHVGFAKNGHGVHHSADETGTVHGITYTEGANIGCIGCHASSLVSEHSSALIAGSMEGGAGSSCRVCHYDEDDPTSGTTGKATAVRTAIDNHDRRCISCHKSGTDQDTSNAVASPHKKTSTETTLAAGAVWSDPFDDWKTAFDAETGGGHNALSADLVGATKSKKFPLTMFEIGGETYEWGLMPNSGDRQWLRADKYPYGDDATLEAIQSLRVTCDDCHYFPSGAAGPQGAAVTVRIDPEYSQTAWANPVPGSNQFRAEGTDRVICDKCHTIRYDSVETTYKPGGPSYHYTHSYGTHAFACTACHIRIPHAWRRPRLLVRTVETTLQPDVVVDEYPYVAENHQGLMAIKLKSYSDPTTLTRDNCAAGSCYSSSRKGPENHPAPEMIPDATFWP